MHGPKVMVNQKNRKTYLIAFLDDHSRLIVFAGFYLSENLGAFMDALIHARPYKPQGKGKIERFFRTIRSELLPTADISGHETLNHSLNQWLETV